MMQGDADDAAFPDDVMHEILRCGVLDSGTLARCCLLAHRYLATARKWLYCEVEMGVVESRIGGFIDGDDEWQEVLEYSCRTADMIASIRRNPALAQLIRHAFFTREGHPSGLRTRGADAVATILVLAPRIDTLEFSDLRVDEWLEEALLQLDYDLSPRLLEVYFGTMTERTSEFVSNLPNLRQLGIKEVESHVEGVQLSTTCLESLSILSDTDLSTFSLPHFVAPSASTLRNLRVHLYHLEKIDLRAYPGLKRVELCLIQRLDRGSRTPPAFRRQSFNERFRGCENLTTIAFRAIGVDRRQSAPELRPDILGKYGGIAGFGSNGLSQLRRVEFTHDFSIRELHMIVDPGGRPVAKLAINRTSAYNLDLGLVRTMCENAGVDLIFLD
ncbi:hypothetical protein JCM3766R1_004883 [Sporobolomyces carnicolor]